MAEIAVALRRALERRRQLGETGRTAARVLAHGDGWRVADVVCTSGPGDRTFEEQHAHYAIAVVLAGTFQYSSQAGRALMTPGSLMLGRPGQCFECGHEHADGDRCVSFSFDTDYFERIIAGSGHARRRGFAAMRIPPLRSTAPIIASVAANLVAPAASWDELGVTLSVAAVALADGETPSYRVPLNAEVRVSRSIRAIDREPAAPVPLDNLARDADLSPYHFLRTFQRLTGVTPHQYVVRARLREAALGLRVRSDRILDIALDCGFGDVSNFNRMFRAEFGCSPRAYRRRRT